MSSTSSTIISSFNQRRTLTVASFEEAQRRGICGHMYHIPPDNTHLIYFFSSLDVNFEDLKATRYKFLILIPGLIDGWLTLPYLKPLIDICTSFDQVVIVPNLTSLNGNFGTTSLDQDVDQILALLTYLLMKQINPRLILMGHSTGCQIICRFLEKMATSNDEGRDKLLSKIDTIILQGAVSDPEILQSEDPDTYHELLQEALVSKNRNVILNKPIFGDYQISAQRALDLLQKHGLEDFFSCLHEEDLQFSVNRLVNCFSILDSSNKRTAKRTKIVFLMGAEDEYLPSLAKWTEMVRRVVKEVEERSNIDCQSSIIKGANHQMIIGGAFYDFSELFQTKAKLNFPFSINSRRQQ